MPSVDSREDFVWRMLNRHDIHLTPHGPVVMDVGSHTVVIGKQWIEACAAAFTAEKVKFRKLDNQIVITND